MLSFIGIFLRTDLFLLTNPLKSFSVQVNKRGLLLKEL